MSNNQIPLASIEAPYAKELATYEELLPQLREAARGYGADPDAITIKHGKNYSSVWFGSLLAFRLCLRKSRYIEVPIDSKPFVSAIAPEEDQKQIAGSFWRVKLGKEPAAVHVSALSNTVRAAIDRLPKEWDCCSRFDQCSEAGRCIHPDPTFALSCGYRRILNSGRVFRSRP